VHYKLYRYYLNTKDDRQVHPDKHFSVFNASKGRDSSGEFTEYRGRKNSVLMYVQKYGANFTALVGKHSTERAVTAYDEDEDVTEELEVEDDDYPNAAFMCFPRIWMIACLDSSKVRADSAMERLHLIINRRQKLVFNVEEIRETFDLRKAVKRFRLTEVTFEILPVNPHTEDLGKRLDESRKLDHIRKINGAAHAPFSEPMTLDGGFLTAIQQLQQSGHAMVGFVGQTNDRIEVKVPKPAKARRLAESEEQEVFGENVGVKISVKERFKYPFTRQQVTEMRLIAAKFVNIQVGDPDE